MMDASNNYPGFSYEPDELVKFIATSEIVSLILKSGEIIHYSPVDNESFIKWLRDNNIADVRTESNQHL